MHSPIFNDRHFEALNERCEAEFLAAHQKNPKIDREGLKRTAAWISAGKLARSFEAKYHLLKQPYSNNESLDVYRTIPNDNFLVLKNPRFYIGIAVEVEGTEKDFDACLSAQGPTRARYVDIQPATTMSGEGNKAYFGPHLLLDIATAEPTLINEFVLDPGNYVVYIPFKTVELDDSFRPHLLN